MTPQIPGWPKTRWNSDTQKVELNPEPTPSTQIDEDWVDAWQDYSMSGETPETYPESEWLKERARLQAVAAPSSLTVASPTAGVIVTTPDELNRMHAILPDAYPLHVYGFVTPQFNRPIRMLVDPIPTMYNGGESETLHLAYLLSRADYQVECLVLSDAGGRLYSDLKYLALGLKNNRHLRSIVITNPYATAEGDGLADLFEGLDQNESVESLYFGDQTLWEGGTFRTLEAMIKNNGREKHLALVNCEIDDDQAIKLASALRINHNLKVLDLSDNQIGDRGAQALLDVLSLAEQPGGSNLTLRINKTVFLNLRGNIEYDANGLRVDLISPAIQEALRATGRVEI